MRTAVLADPHLGRLKGGDILRHPVPRARLLEVLGDVDRLVILGDVLELREVRTRAAMSLVEPLFGELGKALLAGAEVVIVPGNHDYLLAKPVLRRVARRRLGLEQTAPVDPGGRFGPLAQALAPARLTIAYPGLWLRPDVYATHGHWLDAHAGGRRFENRVIARFERWLPLPDRAGPRHYERVSAPLYRVAHLFLTGAGRTEGRGPLGLLGRWARKERAREPRPPHAGGAPTSTTAAPSVATGASDPSVAPPAPLPKKVEGRPRTVQAMIEVVGHLQIEAQHVLFGHTHRAGPLPGDDAEAWQSPTGPRLVNLGSWVYEETAAGVYPGHSPYWPGRLVLLDDSGPPRLVGLLDDMPAESWKEPAGRLA
jgi:hypothetical protein